MAESKVTVEDIISVNEALKAGSSLNKLDKTETLCNLSRKAFKENAKKLGYEYKDNTFVFNENIQIEHRSASTVTISNPETKQNKAKLSETKQNKDNLNENKAKLSEIKQNKDNDTEDILRKINEFDDRLKIIEHMLSNSNLAKSDFVLNPRVLEGDIINRSIKAPKSILEDFDKLCEKKHLAAYTKQALLGQALLEFIEKYNK